MASNLSPLEPIDFVRMYIWMTDGRPIDGHFPESVNCRRKPVSGAEKNVRSRCTRCDAEAILKKEK